MVSIESFPAFVAPVQASPRRVRASEAVQSFDEAVDQILILFGVPRSEEMDMGSVAWERIEMEGKLRGILETLMLGQELRAFEQFQARKQATRALEPGRRQTSKDAVFQPARPVQPKSFSQDGRRCSSIACTKVASNAQEFLKAKENEDPTPQQQQNIEACRTKVDQWKQVLSRDAREENLAARETAIVDKRPETDVKLPSVGSVGPGSSVSSSPTSIRQRLLKLRARVQEGEKTSCDTQLKSFLGGVSKHLADVEDLSQVLQGALETREPVAGCP